MHASTQHSPGRALCICVDDYGLHAGVNRATLRLLEQGRVQAVSCMVGGPAWAEGAAELRGRERAGVDLGLHLDLTERPLLQGTRHRLAPLIVSSLLHLLPRRTLRAEIEAQLDAFERALGRRPDHVDGHQHVHQLPVVRDALLAALAARCTAERPWIRAPRSAGGMDAGLKAAVIERLGAAQLAARAAQGGFRTNARLLGVYDFSGGAPRYRQLLRRWLHQARSGDLLLCHPGLEAGADDALAAARQAEFAVLASDDFAAMLLTEGLSLRPMSSQLAGR